MAIPLFEGEATPITIDNPQSQITIDGLRSGGEVPLLYLGVVDELDQIVTTQ